ncbi:hypothetical protein [Variovorax sp. DAIF25]|uniref:hypothetical protein n=1 Tax=Variovorax sp. DAIF25 TaxID=3080983 RepID=UPI003D6B4185
MKKRAVLFFATAFLSGFALSEPVPDGVRAAISNLSLQSWSLKEGSLRLVMDKPLVSPTFYSTAVHLICGEQWQSPGAFQRMRLERIEVLNHLNAQGFALLDASNKCRELGKATGSSGETMIQAAAVRCEAGVCRKRD